jgi:hypothetical protein
MFQMKGIPQQQHSHFNIAAIVKRFMSVPHLQKRYMSYIRQFLRPPIEAPGLDLAFT